MVKLLNINVRIFILADDRKEKEIYQPLYVNFHLYVNFQILI